MCKLVLERITDYRGLKRLGSSKPELSKNLRTSRGGPLAYSKYLATDYSD